MAVDLVRHLANRLRKFAEMWKERDEYYPTAEGIE